MTDLSKIKAQRDGIDRGHAFAESLYELVAERGPEDLSPAEVTALGSHLVSAAILWVQARNRATGDA